MLLVLSVLILSFHSYSHLCSRVIWEFYVAQNCCNGDARHVGKISLIAMTPAKTGSLQCRRVLNSKKESLKILHDPDLGLALSIIDTLHAPSLAKPLTYMRGKVGMDFAGCLIHRIIKQATLHCQQNT